jgi:hypothetical protein
LTAAVACDPKKLKRALETGTLGVGRSVEIQRGGESASTSVGVSQSVGAPLGAGEQLRLTGPRTNGSRLFVAIQGGNGLTGIARFDRLGLRDTGVSTVRVEQRRRVPTATIVPEGTFAFAPTPIKPTAVRYFKR